MLEPMMKMCGLICRELMWFILIDFKVHVVYRPSSRNNTEHVQRTFLVYSLDKQFLFKYSGAIFDLWVSYPVLMIHP